MHNCGKSSEQIQIYETDLIKLGNVTLWYLLWLNWQAIEDVGVKLKNIERVELVWREQYRNTLHLKQSLWSCVANSAEKNFSHGIIHFVLRVYLQ